MQKEEFVSLWVGSISSPEELEKILKTSYTEDGDFIPSIFAHSFNIERYDESVREADFYEESSNSVSRLLEDFSYDHTIIPEFISVCGEHLTKIIMRWYSYIISTIKVSKRRYLLVAVNLNF
ncbi:immunity 22 family protein [Bacillus paralicheniformis]|uniref:immunity 22 family protein n=1 Tax=Bacillus TaxID=1386 RepID=UPI002279FEA9|nr:MULTISPECIES: immunity 22 family protein [Bacillus]WAJ17010.1 immunity 22 family protein [Bacillus paralicheniformis]